MLTLSVEKRNAKEKIGPARKAGKIPAVFYGRKEKSTPIWVSQKDFTKVLKNAGESTVIVLKGAGDDHEALIHEIDRDPVRETVRHADFYVVEKGQKIQVGVPLTFSGVSPAVRDMGAVLIKVLHELKVEAEAKHLPHSIDVDISSLVAFDSQILAKDLKLPEGVTMITSEGDVVAAVAEPKEEVEEAPTTIDMSAIEVEKKGKEVKEGEEGVTPATEATGALEKKAPEKK
jgi:large subunit ribosomal protein L25